MCDFRLSQLFISNSRLFKSKIKRQRDNNQKQNYVAFEENPLQTDLSGKERSCYVSHTEKATSKTTTQQTSYINNFQLAQAYLRSKSSLRENYLLLLLMPALLTKSGSRSIQFLREELLKNLDATCMQRVRNLCNVSCSPQDELDVKFNCDGANQTDEILKVYNENFIAS